MAYDRQERLYWNYPFDRLSKGMKVFVIKRARVRFRLLRLDTRILATLLKLQLYYFPFY